MTTPAADPAPLGLAAFALTTFLLSAVERALDDHAPPAEPGWATPSPTAAWPSSLAGMWEFRNRNVFGATAFGTYGGFWIGLGLYFAAGGAGAAGASRRWPPRTPRRSAKDLGWILLAFAIFNTYMLLWSTLVNAAVFAVFLTLEATEIILFIGFFAGQHQRHQGRRLRRHADRGGRLVHLGGRRGQRHARRRADAAGGQAALGTQADRLTHPVPVIPEAAASGIIHLRTGTPAALGSVG